jgi:hypothetical protein
MLREALKKSISLMVRQTHHERNQTLTDHPELVEGFNQRFSSEKWAVITARQGCHKWPFVTKMAALSGLKMPD